MTPFAHVDDGSVDGVRGAGVIGPYLHGAFEDPKFCAEVFGIDAPLVTSKAFHYERLEAWFEQHGLSGWARRVWAGQVQDASKFIRWFDDIGWTMCRLSVARMPRWVSSIASSHEARSRA